MNIKQNLKAITRLTRKEKSLTIAMIMLIVVLILMSLSGC
jgi:cell division protein FtsL